MSGHGHSHGCSHGGDDHHHDHDDNEMGVQYSLYQKIDMDRLVVFNEAEPNSGKSIFKPWDRRLDRSAFVDSDVDADILFQIPFTGHVKLKGVLLYGGEGETHPSKMRLFANAPQLTLSDCETARGDQEFELARQSRDAAEYSVRTTKFGSLSTLGIYFPTNFAGADDTTRIYYIGLRGEFTSVNREQLVIATYEARAVPQDHKGEIPDATRHQIF